MALNVGLNKNYTFVRNEDIVEDHEYLFAPINVMPRRIKIVSIERNVFGNPILFTWLPVSDSGKALTDKTTTTVAMFREIPKKMKLKLRMAEGP